MHPSTIWTVSLQNFHQNVALTVLNFYSAVDRNLPTELFSVVLVESCVQNKIAQKERTDIEKLFKVHICTVSTLYSNVF